MKLITGIEFMGGSNEERLPDFDADFPLITTCAALDPGSRPFVPWHWHRAVELTYMKSGAIEYHTPKGRLVLPEGCGALVNSNILHTTFLPQRSVSAVQLLHLFDPSLLSGAPGSRIDRKYIRPITASPALELIPLFADNPLHAPILRELEQSFALAPDAPGYELMLREKLSRIWLQIFALVGGEQRPDTKDDLSGRVKQMMAYIHEHYAESVPVKALAQAAICSERECYRAFHACLHMTPSAYLQSYRLQMACRMLLSGRESLTSIAHSCGFGSSSYMGKVFKSATGLTPMQYRRMRQDRQMTGQ